MYWVVRELICICWLYYINIDKGGNFFAKQFEHTQQNSFERSTCSPLCNQIRIKWNLDNFGTHLPVRIPRKNNFEPAFELPFRSFARWSFSQQLRPVTLAQTSQIYAPSRAKCRLSLPRKDVFARQPWTVTAPCLVTNCANWNSTLVLFTKFRFARQVGWNLFPAPLNLWLNRERWLSMAVAQKHLCEVGRGDISLEMARKSVTSAPRY